MPAGLRGRGGSGGFSAAFGGNRGSMMNSFFCIVEMIFVLFGDNAITTRLIGGVKLNLSHVAAGFLFRQVGLCQYGLLAFWSELSAVGSLCE
ncbi:hypothetical protein UA44_10350 [Klebsiella aerogenes]|nr:hypothetical protein UA44_10350 [Klebsiella aerogenes]